MREERLLRFDGALHEIDGCCDELVIGSLEQDGLAPEADDGGANLVVGQRPLDGPARLSCRDIEVRVAHVPRVHRAALIEQHESEKYLTRNVLSEMKEMLEAWDFDGVLVQPVQESIKSCQARLSDFAERRAARSRLLTDLLLLGIGLTSIVGTALALASFGRSTARLCLQ